MGEGVGARSTLASFGAVRRANSGKRQAVPAPGEVNAVHQQ
jgi:hypothetical protein